MSYYNAPFGSEDHPYCPWHGDAGVSNAPLKDECRICREMVDDEDCELVDGVVVCKECIEVYEKDGDGIEEMVRWVKRFSRA